MSTAENAKIQIETGQTVNDYAAMTDSGDHEIFTISGGTVWSGKSGFTPTVRPNGIVSGRNILSAHADNDKVSIAAFTAYSKATLQSVAATAATFTRPATASKAKVYSVTMASDGSIAVVAGTISADTTFSATRDAAGGPPLIPLESVELGQIRVTSGTAAALSDDEVYQVVGTHTERYDYPLWDENNIGYGNAATASAEENAHIKFYSTLGLIHTGAVAKKVYIKYYEPIFSDLARPFDFVPVEESHSVNSQEFYGGTVSSTSKSLGQGSFSALLSDGVTDALVSEKGNVLTVKFFPDENESPYILTQGSIGLTRSFPYSNQIQADVTITAEQESAEFSS